MPLEGHYKIEQLLREHAERRRTEAGAPLELHPATRRLLLGEVARLVPKIAARRPWHHFKTRLWPRLSFGVTTLAVFAVVGWAVVRFWNDLEGVGDVAKRDAEFTPTLGGMGGGKNAGASAPLELAKNVPEAADRFVLSADGLHPVKDAAPPASGTPASPPRVVVPAGEKREAPGSVLAFSSPALAAPESGAGGGRGVRARVLSEPLSLTVNPAPAPNDPAGKILSITLGDLPADGDTKLNGPEAGVARAQGFRTKGIAENKVAAATARPPQFANGHFYETQEGWADKNIDTALRFSQVRPEGAPVAAKDARATVLSSFEVRRNAGKIRIFDADGSAYEGQIVANDDASFVVESRKKSAGPRVVLEALQNKEVLKGEKPSELKRDVAAPQTWSFHASGTNRTLNQLVTITGSMTGPADESAELDFKQKRLNDAGAAVSIQPAPVLTAPVGGANPSAPVTRGAIRADESATQQIQGKVRIGAGPERELKALRVTR